MRDQLDIDEAARGDGDRSAGRDREDGGVGRDAAREHRLCAVARAPVARALVARHGEWHVSPTRPANIRSPRSRGRARAIAAIAATTDAIPPFMFAAESPKIQSSSTLARGW